MTRADMTLVETELDRYRARTPESARLHSEASAIVPGGLSRGTLAYPPYPFYGSRGDGARLIDVDGNSYIDMINNYTSLIHGHCHQPTADAVAHVLTTGQALGTPTATEAQLAKVLTERIPAVEAVRFTTTGSEALQYAIRIARAATGRKRVLKFEGAFHGSETALAQDIWAPPLPAGTAIPARPASAGLDDVSTITAVFNDPAAVSAAFAQWGGEIAVVVVEPYLGNNALISAKPDFLDAVFTEARRSGALVLVDEIQGLRAAYGGSQSVFGVQPDLVTMGKIISGGFALAAYGGRRDLIELMAAQNNAIPQSGTFTAVSAATAAGLAALHHYQRADYDRLEALRNALAEAVIEEFSRKAIPVQVNGLGSMFHVSLNSRPVDSYARHSESDHELWSAIRLGLLNRGVNMMLRGTGCLSTPMDSSTVDEVAAALRDVLDQLP